MSHLQCRLIVFASTNRNAAMSFRRHLEAEMTRFAETRGLPLSVESRPDGKGVVLLDVPARLGGQPLLRMLNVVGAAAHELLRIYPEWQKFEVNVLGDGVTSFRIGPARFRKKRAAMQPL